MTEKRIAVNRAAMSRQPAAVEVEVSLSKSEIAAALGALGRGKKKSFTPEQRAALRDRLARVRSRRWANRPAKPEPQPPQISAKEKSLIGKAMSQLAHQSRTDWK